MKDNHFFIKAALHCLFACNYYKYNNMDNLEAFLKHYDLDNFNVHKDESLQKELELDDKKFKYYCFGIKMVIKIYQKEMKEQEGERVDVNTFIHKYKDYSKTSAESLVRFREYNKKNKSNETEISDIGTSKNNKVQVSPIQASASKDIMMEEDNIDTFVEGISNNNDDICLDFSPDNTTRRTTNRSRKAIEFLEYPPNHCGTSKQSKRLKTHQSVNSNIVVEDPLAGQGSIVTSDDLKNLDLENDGIQVLDIGLFGPSFPWEFLQLFLGIPNNRGIMDLSQSKWIPCFNNENDFDSDSSPPSKDTKRWMSGSDIEDGFWENEDLKEKVNICNCYLQHIIEN